jgi:hypothetical protein
MSKLFFFFFPTPPIKLKLGLQIGERLLIINHLDDHYDWPIRIWSIFMTLFSGKC